MMCIVNVVNAVHFTASFVVRKKKEGYRLTFKGGQNWTQNKLVVAEKLGVFRLLGSGKSGIVK